MKIIRNSFFALFFFTTTAQGQTLRLSSIVRPNINIYYDKVDGLRIISNSYFKKSVRPFRYKSNTKNIKQSNKKFKVLEVSMN